MKYRDLPHRFRQDACDSVVLVCAVVVIAVLMWLQSRGVL
jgi:hypothetical protein